MTCYIKFTFSIFIIFILIQYNPCICGIFSWMFKNYETNSNKNLKTDDEHPQIELSKNDRKVLSDDVASSSTVPFEMKTTDEKFITALSEFISSKLSKLDICHHKVIISLQKSCSDLTEEELSKVAVNLLNCQSAAEDRPIYPCTEEMLLHECTGNMDPNTWNAYHTVSNRVRAVCYNFRQQQFTAKTEMTVNKLVQSTEEQLDSMKLLEESQNVLKTATSDTLESLHSGHKMLETQQRELSDAHVNIHNYVSSNIKELTKEKRLIVSGQRELAQITLSIRKKLEDAQEQLKDQGNGQRSTHKKILDDLSGIQESASKVWGQIDESTKKILHNHEQTVEYYTTLMKDLQKMNSTVHHLMDISIKMKQKVEEKFSWITALAGETDATVQKIYSCILHMCYCLLGMIAASFLQVPYLTRMALIILVPLNAVSEMKTTSSLPFSTLTLLLGGCMFCNLSIVGIVRVRKWRRVKHLESISDTSSYNEYSFSRQYKSINPNETSIPWSKPAKLTECIEGPSITGEVRTEDRGRRSESPSRGLDASPSPSPAASFTSEHEFRDRSSETRTDYSFTKYCNINQKSSESDLLNSVRRRLLLTSFGDDSSHLHSVSLNNSLPSPPSRDRHKENISPEVQHSGSSTSPHWKSLLSRKLCSAICKSGLPCKNGVARAESLCFRHLNGISRESTPRRH